MPIKEAVTRLAPRPLLLIATGRPAEQRLARELFALADEPKYLWQIRGARHRSGWRQTPQGYGFKLVAFFNHALFADELADFGQTLDDIFPDGGTDGQTAGAEADAATGDVDYDATLSLSAANLFALAVVPVVFLLFIVPYAFRWGGLIPAARSLINIPFLTAVFVLIGSVVSDRVRFQSCFAKALPGQGPACRSEAGD